MGAGSTIGRYLGRVVLSSMDRIGIASCYFTPHMQSSPQLGNHSMNIMMYRSLAVSMLAAVPMALATPRLVDADEPSNDAETQKQIANHWIGVSREYAKTYSIFPQVNPDSPFELYDHAVFQHIQTVRGNDIGAVHLWIHEDGRPAAIATVFGWTISNDSRMLHNELHSLADEPISATRSGRLFWESKEAGTQWTPVPDAPSPQDSPRRRRAEAKQLAKKFTSYMIDRRGERWELRRVPTPIYEYDVKNDPKRGGAIFAYCRGTDIETLLLLEVRDAQRERRWEFTCAKFTDYEPHMVVAGKDVWKPFEDAYQQSGNPHFWAPIGPHEMPEVEKNYRRRTHR